LRFVDEGSRLIENLDAVIGSLLSLYPKPEKPHDLQAIAAGYVMKEQHAIHASVFGEEEEASHGRLSEVTEGEDYGVNVELF
jgi:hypothetical protein